MPKIRENERYDPLDENSIVKFAGELTETTLREWIVPENVKDFKGKGQFGQILEEGVFYIETNSEAKPDFEDAGIELKSTPIKKLTNGKKVPKERLSLSNINYMKILEDGWEGSFWNKNQKLLIIFYLYEKDKLALDYRILKTIMWEYPEEDLKIIRKDWEIIAQKVREGKAHELSERDTTYLSASRKGVGGPKDNRRQPNSLEFAPQRAFALKPSYVSSIWEKSRGAVHLDNFEGPGTMTFEEEVLSRFDRFKGMSSMELRGLLDPSMNPTSKSFYSQIARRMIGIKGVKVEEFEKADIHMKTVRLQKNGVPKESMSFPSFDYMDEADMNWEDSDLYQRLFYMRFLLVVFQIEDDRTYFKGVTFWSIPFDDFEEVRRVWKRTINCINDGSMDLPKISESEVAHVRPHGRNSMDRKKAPDGNMYTKNSFWLNASYVGKQLKMLKLK